MAAQNGNNGLSDRNPGDFGLPDNLAKLPDDFEYAELNRKNFNQLLNFLEEINEASNKFSRKITDDAIIASTKDFFAEIHQAGFHLEDAAQKGFLNFVRRHKKWMIIPAAIMGIGGSAGYAYESAAGMVGEFASDHPDMMIILSKAITTAAYSGLFVYKNLEAKFHTQQLPLSGAKKSLIKSMEKSGLPGLLEKSAETLKQKMKMIGIAALSGIEGTAAVGHAIDALTRDDETEFWVAIARAAAFATVLGPMAGQTYNKNFRDSDYFKPTNRFERFAKRTGDWLHDKLDSKDPRIAGILVPALAGTLLAGPAVALLHQGLQENQPVKIYSSFAMIGTYLLSISYLALGEVKRDRRTFMNNMQFERMNKAVVDYNYPIIMDRINTYKQVLRMDEIFKEHIDVIVKNAAASDEFEPKSKAMYNKLLQEKLPTDAKQDTVRMLIGDIEVMAAEIERLPFIYKSLPKVESTLAGIVADLAKDFPEIGKEIKSHFTKVLNTGTRKLLETGDPAQESARVVGAEEALYKPGKRKIEFGKDEYGFWFESHDSIPEMTKEAMRIFNSSIEEYKGRALWSDKFPIDKNDLSWAQKLERGFARKIRRRNKIEIIEAEDGGVIWKMDKEDEANLAELVERMKPFEKPENVPPHVTQVFMDTVLGDRTRKTARREEIAMFQG